MDFETETFVVSTNSDIAHTLTGGGFDASEDGTGRGTPIVAFNARQDPDCSGDVTHPLDTHGSSVGIAFDTTQITSGENRANPQPGDPCHPLSTPAPQHSDATRIRQLAELYLQGKSHLARPLPPAVDDATAADAPPPQVARHSAQISMGF